MQREKKKEEGGRRNSGFYVHQRNRGEEKKGTEKAVGEGTSAGDISITQKCMLLRRATEDCESTGRRLKEKIRRGQNEKKKVGAEHDSRYINLRVWYSGHAA